MEGSCRSLVALLSGALECHWQWESGGLVPSRALEVCPQELGYLPEGPHRPFSPCPLACTLSLAGSRVGVALKAPLLVHGQSY